MSMSAPSASAASGYDLWALSAANRVVSSTACRYVKVTARTNAPDGDNLLATTEVWLDGEFIDEVVLRSAGPGRLAGNFRHCPREHYVGEFRLGPSEVEYLDEHDLVEAFVDNSRTRFKAKQAARFTAVKAVRKGKTLTVTARPQFYGIGNDRTGWAPATQKYRRGKYKTNTAFRLQRLTSTGWKTVKTARAPKTKTLTMKVKAKRSARYRLVSNETLRTFSQTSKTFRR